MKSERYREPIAVVPEAKEWGNLSGALDFIHDRNISRRSKLLDIGCYTGSLIHNLNQLGYHDVYGIDLDKSSIHRGSKIYPKLVGRLKYYDGVVLPYENNTFDLVTMFDVLEHISDVEKFLSEEVRRVLKPAGMLIFQTPNKFTNIPWEIFVHKSFSRYKTYHVSLQSYSSLLSLLKNCMFVDICIEKRDVRTNYYREQLKAKMGVLSEPILFMVNHLPVRCATNFWGYCKSGDQPLSG